MMPLPPMNADGRRIRVLLVTDEMEVGGTQRQIVHIARTLDRGRFEPSVIYFRNRSFLVDELEQSGVPVIEIPKHGRIDLDFIASLTRFLRQGGFDLMHCFSFTGELWGAIARRLLNPAHRPVLITSVRNKYEWYSPLQWRLKRWVSMESSRVIANSHAGGEYARSRMELAPGSIDVVYNGVAGKFESGAIPPAPLSERVTTALFVGRLVEHKNLPVLLRAMRRLHEAAVPIRLQIVGDGPLRDKCALQIAQSGLAGCVDLLGERADTHVVMAASDFVVLPSLREGLSNVILEAMLVGRPVIASAVGGNIELVEPMQTGLLFASDNDAELADAMKRLIDDPALRQRLGQQGRQRATQRFTVAAMVQAMQEFYLRCAAEQSLRCVTNRG